MKLPGWLVIDGYEIRDAKDGGEGLGARCYVKMRVRTWHPGYWLAMGVKYGREIATLAAMLAVAGVAAAWG